MNKKKILILIGVASIIGIGIYLFNKNKKPSQMNTTDDAEVNSKTATGSPNTTDSANTTDSPNTTKIADVKGTNIKDLKGKEKREYRKETRDICKEKYGKGKDYRQCKSRVKKGGVAFIGDFDDFENDYIDFEGQVDNQFINSEFENSLNLDL